MNENTFFYEIGILIEDAVTIEEFDEIIRELEDLLDYAKNERYSLKDLQNL